MIDQSHNLKGKIEAMVQTVAMAQELYAKAALVDLEQLDTLQRQCELVEAEECFRSAFWEDVRPAGAGMAPRPGLAGRSPAGASREWLRGADRRGTGGEERKHFSHLRLDSEAKIPSGRFRCGRSGNCRSLGFARDDKGEGGRFDPKAMLIKSSRRCRKT